MRRQRENSAMLEWKSFVCEKCGSVDVSGLRLDAVTGEGHARIVYYCKQCGSLTAQVFVYSEAETQRETEMADAAD